MPSHRLPTDRSLESPENGQKSIVTDQDKPKEQKIFKILVIGEVSVGKTSLIKRYVHNLFSQQYRATIGVDFALKKIIWNDETEIIIQLWDIAGQDRFASLTRVYYKGSSGSFVVTDASKPESFESAIRWKKDFDSKVTLADGQPVPSVLLINKCDLERAGIAGDEAKLDCFSKENGFINWFYVSAKENIGVKEAAKIMIKKIMEIYENYYNSEINGNEVDRENGHQSSVDKKGVLRVTNASADGDSRVKRRSRCDC